MIALAYDAFSLQGDGIYTSDTDIYSLPPRTIQAPVLANRDGSKIVNTRYESKVFTCSGYMKAEHIPALDLLIDQFKTALNKQNQYFEMDYGEETRRYIATPRNLIISRERGLNAAGWSCEFFCEDPVGWATEPWYALNDSDTVTATSSLATIPLYINGSYKAEPEITVVFTDITATGEQTVTISNAGTLRGVFITRTWADGDVLEIDSLKKTIYVNGATFDFGGQFPVWDTGLGGLTYNDTFTDRSVDITVMYTRRFL